MDVVTARRQQEDACPGVLRPHHAADGELLRVRLPGGGLPAAAMRSLTSLSAEFGDGRLGLTSRANVQLRGLDAAAVPVVVGHLRALGLLPATAVGASHERVRNIITSPLSGRGPGSLADVDPLAGDLDAALCARPGLAQLPGRFLFAVDDGSLDVAAQRPDVLAVALGQDRFALDLGGAGFEAGFGVVGGLDVVAVMLAAAEAFLAERAAGSSGAWRVAELPGGAAGVLRRLSAAWPDRSEVAAERPAEAAPALQPGLIEQRDERFAVCAAVPLGLLQPDQAVALAAAADLSEAPARGPRVALRITPWRRAVVRDLELPAALAARELLASVGLEVTPDTAWSRLSACAGRPGCASSLTDVHSDARAFAARCARIGPAVHWAGCERACGTPAGGAVQVIATPAGYRVSGELGAGDRALIGLG